MAATNPTKPRRRRFRLSGLEMFGFIDTPGSASTPGIPTPVIVAEAAPLSPPPAPALGPAPSDDPFADWHPADIGQRLPGRRVRWGLLTSMLIFFAGLASVALWVYQIPQEEARRSRETLGTAVQIVDQDLTDFAAVNTTLDAQSMDTTVVNQILLRLEDNNRQMFAAAGGLPADQSLARGRVIDVSGTVSEAQRVFTEAYTYRLAVVPILAPTTFETDPTLTTLEDAAEAFSDWQARFEAVRTALPEGAFPEVTLKLHSLGAALPEIQRTYLDSLRVEDPTAAAAALGRLNDALEDAGSLLFEGLTETRTRVDGLIIDAADGLTAVPLMLG